MESQWVKISTASQWFAGFLWLHCWIILLNEKDALFFSGIVTQFVWFRDFCRLYYKIFLLHLVKELHKILSVTLTLSWMNHTGEGISPTGTWWLSNQYKLPNLLRLWHRPTAKKHILFANQEVTRQLANNEICVSFIYFLYVSHKCKLLTKHAIGINLHNYYWPYYVIIKQNQGSTILFYPSNFEWHKNL